MEGAAHLDCLLVEVCTLGHAEGFKMVLGDSDLAGKLGKLDVN